VAEEGPGEGAAKLVGVVDGQDGGAGVLVEPRLGGVGVAKKWTWPQNAERIEVTSPGVTMDTTAVAGCTPVTLSGSTVSRTGCRWCGTGR
jgi:hypothetical protein